MSDAMRTLRGVVGTGVAGAVLGGLAAAVVAVALSILSPGAVSLSVASVFVGGMAAFGGTAGAGFAAMLAVTHRGRPLEAVSRWKAGGLGAVAGLLIPLAAAPFVPETVLPDALGELVLLGAMMAPLTGGVSLGLVEVAKSTRRRELQAGDDGPTDGDPPRLT